MSENHVFVIDGIIQTIPKMQHCRQALILAEAPAEQYLQFTCRVCDNMIRFENRTTRLRPHATEACPVFGPGRILFIAHQTPYRSICLRCNLRGSRHTLWNPCSKTNMQCRSCSSAGLYGFDHLSWSGLCILKSNPEKFTPKEHEIIRNLRFRSEPGPIEFQYFLTHEESERKTEMDYEEEIRNPTIREDNQMTIWRTTLHGRPRYNPVHRMRMDRTGRREIEAEQIHQVPAEAPGPNPISAQRIPGPAE